MTLVMAAPRMVRISLLGAATLAAGCSTDSTGEPPTILIDVAHYNLVDIVDSHTSWLENEGFTVRILRHPFDHESLDGVDIILIESPLARRNSVTRPWTEEKFDLAWQPPFPSAFSADEISTLHTWVTSGGGLGIIFDHMPVSNAVDEMATAFGVTVSNGFAFDERMLRWESDSLSIGEAGSVVFRRIDHTLADHPITDGRSIVERVDSAALGGGAAFLLPPEGLPLLTLGESFVSLRPEIPWLFQEDTPRHSIGAWLQGGTLRVGRGRLAIFSDLGILATHDEVAAQDPPWNGSQLQNPQLFLNTIRWLSAEIDPDD